LLDGNEGYVEAGMAWSMRTNGPDREILAVEDVLELLRLDIARVGGQSEWARQTGVSRMEINRALQNRRRPPLSLCQALGLEWVVVRQIAGEDGRLQRVVVETRDFLSSLKAEIEKVGSITVWCDQNGFNRTYLSQVLNKRRPASSKLVAALDLAEVLVRA
jgi:DNA-binding phage protein